MVGREVAGTPRARVLLALGAAIVVAVADGVSYLLGVCLCRAWWGRKREGEREEVREVVKTWVVGGEGTEAKERLKQRLSVRERMRRVRV